MIKFFRKIRQSLLSENKFSKYLIYAVGEIVLVVIGILIALQINNWNGNKAAQARIDSRIINLTKDIESDITEMDEILQVAKDRIIVVKSILEGSNRLGSFGISEGSTSLSNFEAFKEPTFESTLENYENPNSKLSLLRTLDGNGPTYNELINSGEFHLIKDRLLAKKIQNYYFNIAETKDRESINNKPSNVDIYKSKNRLGLGTHSKEGTMEKLIEMAKNDHQFGAELEHRYIMDVAQYNNTLKLKLQALDLREAIKSTER
ncbi:DUF6090 family protein [Eudoraea chungangensis]|uniref:DUF6090 family protein n=1 Tax=Eudoraea chungangensis TaxID=1481905 RepID=UPI0023EC4218|nr:DUF6090 family protein [Eudoraea chungangensis]